MSRAVLALLVAATLVVGAIPATAVVDPGADGGDPTTPSTAAGGPLSAVGDPHRSSTDLRSEAIVEPAANTTNFLSLAPEQVQRSRVDIVTLDTMGSVAVDTGRIHGRYELRRLQRSYLQAPNRSARRAVVRYAADRIGTKVDRLVARERAALAAYNAGKLSTQGYLRELAAIDAEARQLEQAVNQLHSYSNAVGEPVSTRRLARMKVQLLTVTGPVRQRVAAAMTGTPDGDTRVFIRTSSTGVVLSVVIQRDFATEYVREAYLGSALVLNNTGKREVKNIDQAEERFKTLYPWTTNQTFNVGLITDAPYYLDAGVYVLWADHHQGASRRFDIESYLDASNGETFREFQFKDVARVPTRTLVTNTSQGLRLYVNGTRVGGPLEVQVINTTTGEPVAADVSVSGRDIGRTGQDGQLWTVAPSSSFVVKVSGGDRTLTAGVNESGRQFDST